MTIKFQVGEEQYFIGDSYEQCLKYWLDNYILNNSDYKICLLCRVADDIKTSKKYFKEAIIDTSMDAMKDRFKSISVNPNPVFQENICKEASITKEVIDNWCKDDLKDKIVYRRYICCYNKKGYFVDYSIYIIDQAKTFDNALCDQKVLLVRGHE